MFGQAGSATNSVVARQGSWISLVSRKDYEKDADALETRRLLNAEELIKEQGGEFIRQKVSDQQSRLIKI